MQANGHGLTYRHAAALALALVLPHAGAMAQTDEELAFARDHLDGLQLRSFRTGREYCGFFGYDPKGRLVAVKARPGSAASCTAIWPHARIRVFASYHTHGAWDEYTDGEVPSVEDMQGDMADGIQGYISTPGGRFWFIDGPSGVARQICGQGCLATDPAFRPEADEPVPETLTLEALKLRQGDQ
jgi:hypothetical protein